MPTPTAHNYLRLNVGFIIHESVGYTRDFPFDFPKIQFSPDLLLYDLRGYVRVSRTAQGLLLQLKMAASIDAECGRCLTGFRQPLAIDSTELYAFTPDSMTESGLLVPETGKIDLSPWIRDEMLLAIPIQPLCKETCKGLCPVCGENLNEKECRHEAEVPDPRLAILKDLVDKDLTAPGN